MPALYSAKAGGGPAPFKPSSGKTGGFVPASTTGKVKLKLGPTDFLDSVKKATIQLHLSGRSAPMTTRDAIRAALIAAEIPPEDILAMWRPENQRLVHVSFKHSQHIATCLDASPLLLPNGVTAHVEHDDKAVIEVRVCWVPCYISDNIFFRFFEEIGKVKEIGTEKDHLGLQKGVRHLKLEINKDAMKQIPNLLAVDVNGEEMEFLVQVKGRQSICLVCGEAGHQKRDCPMDPRPKQHPQHRDPQREPRSDNKDQQQDKESRPTSSTGSNSGPSKRNPDSDKRTPIMTVLGRVSGTPPSRQPKETVKDKQTQQGDNNKQPPKNNDSESKQGGDSDENTDSQNTIPPTPTTQNDISLTPETQNPLQLSQLSNVSDIHNYIQPGQTNYSGTLHGGLPRVKNIISRKGKRTTSEKSDDGDSIIDEIKRTKSTQEETDKEPKDTDTDSDMDTANAWDK